MSDLLFSRNFLMSRKPAFSESNSSKYKILEKIGGGANGDVHLATRLTDNKKVAVKYLKNFDFNSRRRFQNEVQIYQTLKKSPFIVRILDYSLQSNTPYLVMEYCAYGNARNQIKYFKENPAESVKLLLGVAKGIKQIHSLGTFHRDIKPDNLLFTKDLLDNYVLKVGDAGMSCFLPNQNMFNNQTYTIQGTRNYIDPELFRGVAFNEKSDIYSFGVTCHELLTGFPPIAGQVVTQGPVEMQNLIQRMISTNSKYRPNIDDIIAEMETALQQIKTNQLWSTGFTIFGLGVVAGSIFGIISELFKRNK
jgi:serine/threonine protein kinase